MVVNQYYLNVLTVERNLQTQGNPYQNINGIFHRTRMNNPKNSVWNHKRPSIAKLS